jgi:diphthamide synthase (EF-2-diphthine--ammonia ligase)
MTATRKRAAISFTGGKDCTLAMAMTKATHDVVLLVTFGPKNFRSFKAHSLEIIQLQAKAMAVPHILVEIGEEGKTHLECYREKIAEIKAQYNLDLLVTGKALCFSLSTE